MDGGKLIAKTRSISMTNRTLGLNAAQVGTVTDAEPLHQVLLEAKTLLEKTKFHFDDILKHSSQGEIEMLKHIPGLIYRAAVEIVAPLLLELVFRDICQILSIDAEKQSMKQWIMILLLCFLDLDGYFQELPTTDFDATAVSVAKSSAFSLRNHLTKIQERFALVKWEGVNRDQKTPPRHFALGFPEVQKGSKVYVLEADKNLFLAADPNQSDQNPSCDAFRGMLFQLEVGEMIGLVPSRLFGPLWKSSKRGENAHLTFVLRDFDVGHA
jgi:hypothetical protein